MQVELGGGPYALAAGPDGALWVTLVHGGEIARVTARGQVERFEAGSRPSIITAGPDGALWFTRADAIVRMTTGGEQTAFALSRQGRSGSPRGRTARCGSRRPTAWAGSRSTGRSRSGRCRRARSRR